jgi:hypothetical protein
MQTQRTTVGQIAEDVSFLLAARCCGWSVGDHNGFVLLEVFSGHLVELIQAFPYNQMRHREAEEIIAVQRWGEQGVALKCHHLRALIAQLWTHILYKHFANGEVAHVCVHPVACRSVLTACTAMEVFELKSVK